VLAILDKGAAAMALEEGETRVYGAAKPGAVVRIREAGDIDVEPHTAKHIKLGASATKAVALHQDAVTQTAEFFAWMGLVSTAAGVAPMSAFDPIGQVSASATKVKGE
jgi:phage gp45-like